MIIKRLQQNRQIYLLLFLIYFGVLQGKPLENLDTLINYDVNLDLPDGFHYSFRTNKGASAKVRGIVLAKDDLTIEGSYGFITDGSSVQVSYEADENGFRPHVVQTNLPETTPVDKSMSRPEVIIGTACLASLSGGGCG
ncbi:pupal cuticle protein 20-like [Anthonomus grandis grandis]|uniref:pupal cuticle protein 20-like n=1 Tax=Anthonomus grandis grandis TaxID=2921223 RepID=UPI002166B1B9|nr:pupal cuticle protein 20-like [Anthonomus grandis grandis]